MSDDLEGKSDEELSRMSAAVAKKIVELFVAENTTPCIAVTAMAAVLGSTCSRCGVDPRPVIGLFAESFNGQTLETEREANQAAEAMADEVIEPDKIDPVTAARVLDELAAMVRSHGQGQATG